MIPATDALSREASSVAGETDMPPEASFTAVPAEEGGPLDITFTSTSVSPDHDPLTLYCIATLERLPPPPIEGFAETVAVLPAEAGFVLVRSDGVVERRDTTTGEVTHSFDAVTPAAGVLIFGKQHRSLDVGAALRSGDQIGVGGAGFGDHVDLAPGQARPGQSVAQRRRVQRRPECVHGIAI